MQGMGVGREGLQATWQTSLEHNPAVCKCDCFAWALADLICVLHLERDITPQVQSMQSVGVSNEARQVTPSWQAEAGCSSCRGVQLQQRALCPP